VFSFFSEAANLEKLTPEWLNFRMDTRGPITMEKGALIQYRICWHGIPLRWTTRIARWDPPFSFVDNQIAGPYRLWHHTHLFKEERGGTRLTDVVRYALPLGFAGRWAHAIKVRRDVEIIFSYRAEQVERIFGRT
jgi:ligand-binding SRPBCC domain-containing protein